MLESIGNSSTEFAYIVVVVLYWYCIRKVYLSACEHAKMITVMCGCGMRWFIFHCIVMMNRYNFFYIYIFFYYWYLGVEDDDDIILCSSGTVMVYCSGIKESTEGGTQNVRMLKRWCEYLASKVYMYSLKIVIELSSIFSKRIIYINNYMWCATSLH